MRDSPAIAIIRSLQDAGAHVRSFDLEGTEQARLVLSDIDYAADPYAAIDGADALAIATEWDAFRALDLGRVKTLLKEPVLIDLRNIYAPAEVEAAALRYTGIGR